MCTEISGKHNSIREVHMRTLVMFGLVLVAVAVVPASAQIPKQLSYQGVLTDTLGNARPDGQYTMTFRLYSAEDGGSALWTEAKDLPVKDAIFTTYLGDTTPFPGSITWDTPYWLSIQVGAAPELTPRVKLGSVAYSLNPGGGSSPWITDSTTGFLSYGGDNVYIGRNFPISGNEAFGFRYNGGPNEYGGMYAETSDPAGWPFYGYATNGSFRAWTYLQPESTETSGPAWKLYYSGVRLTVPNSGGLRIGPAADYSLVIENTTGSDGIRILDTGDDGIQIGSNPDIPNYGVYIPSPGVTTYGLWSNTSNASGEWALYTVDNIQAGNVLAGAYSLIAKVTGSDALTKGDIVAATGVTDPVPGSQPSMSLVRLADDRQFTGVVGVVQRRMVWALAPGKEAEGAMSLQSTDGPAQPGDYVSLAVLGVADVKVDGSTSIAAGQRLTAGIASGRARALRTKEIEGMVVSEGAQVIGVALAPSSGSDTIPVHLTLR
jgi:hypothetical protein